MMEEDTEIPKYFICPISLQIMKDPVTTVTGITYDRESIEHWQQRRQNNTCPVTNQPLPPDSALTPNHTLRRLIQSWCASKGIDQVPTTLKPPLKKSHVTTLLKNLRIEENSRALLKTLKELEALSATYKESDTAVCMREAGVPKAMMQFIQTCSTNREIIGLKEALSVLYLVKPTPDQTRLFLSENKHFVDSLTWVLGLEDVDNDPSFKLHAILLLKQFIDKANSNELERLNRDFLDKIILVLKQRGMSQAGIRAALDVMLSACPWGRNRILMVECGAVFELIELGLTFPEKPTTELILGVLFHLCSSADGRDQLLSHAAGLAFVSKKMLRVSPKADDRIMLILSLILKFSGTSVVLQEMLRLETVSKLCMVLQYDRPSYLKEKARELLRNHSNVWNNSDCVKVSAVTKFTR